MKAALALVLLSTVASAFASHGVHKRRCTGSSTKHSHTTQNTTQSTGSDITGGWGQRLSGTASFTQYSGCGSASCGIPLTGFSAATNTFAFGAYTSSGGACGRCFKITGTHDPYTPSFAGPFNSIVVRVNDLCPMESNQQWCSQRASQPTNQFGASMHFDLCMDSGAPQAFFPSGRAALTGTFEEVPCDGNWSGSKGESLWNGSCLAGDGTGLWPDHPGCPNVGTPPQ